MHPIKDEVELRFRSGRRHPSDQPLLLFGLLLARWPGSHSGRRAHHRADSPHV